MPSAHLFASSYTPQAVQRLLVKRNRQRFWRRSPNTHPHGLAFIEQASKILIGKLVPSDRLSFESPSLGHGQLLRHC
jgi:hypothetical protein